jgi:hypothetical protein
MEILETGDFAYYESHNGFVACKVLNITGATGLASTAQRVKIQITVSRNGFHRGETFETSGLHVTPRGSIGSIRIKPYTVRVDEVGPGFGQAVR